MFVPYLFLNSPEISTNSKIKAGIAWASAESLIYSFLLKLYIIIFNKLNELTK